MQSLEDIVAEKKLVDSKFEQYGARTADGQSIEIGSVYVWTANPSKKFVTLPEGTTFYSSYLEYVDVLTDETIQANYKDLYADVSVYLNREIELLQPIVDAAETTYTVGSAKLAALQGYASKPPDKDFEV